MVHTRIVGKFFSGTAVVAMLSGCAPFWAVGTFPTAMINFPPRPATCAGTTTKDDQGNTCDRKIVLDGPDVTAPVSGASSELPDHSSKDVCSANDPEGDLRCAQQEVANLADVYAGEAHNVEDVKALTSLGLLGIGTAAGVNTVQKGSKIQLQTLGLIAAGLATGESVLNIDGQRAAYVAGATAMRCVIAVDKGLVAAAAKPKPDTNGKLALDSLETFSGTHASRTFDVTVEASVQAALRAAESSQLDAAGVSSSSSLPLGIYRQAHLWSLVGIASANDRLAISGLSANSTSSLLELTGLKSLIVADSQIEAAANANAELAASLAQATDDETHAAALINAIDLIKQAVSDSLYKAIDVSKIYDAMKSGIGKLGGDPAAKATKAADATAAAAGSAKPVMVTALQLRTAQSNLDAASSAALELMTLTAADGATDSTKQLTDAYSECVSAMTPKPTPKGGATP